MLNRFLEAKREEIERLRRMRETGSLPDPVSGQRPGFAGSIRGVPGAAVIAEYKRASPSQGRMGHQLEPQQAGEAYARAGAAAVSVLTEARYFQGDLSLLQDMGACPAAQLRKDFILDQLQILETASTPASAVLLIAGLFSYPEADLARLLRRSEELGLETVVEVTSGQELDAARQAGARIIQVNNRDLATLEVDSEKSRELVRHRDHAETWISASGIQGPEDVAEVRDLGFDACLVGTCLSRSPDPEAFLAGLVRAGKPRENK